jgi:hypothetical protein
LGSILGIYVRDSIYPTGLDIVFHDHYDDQLVGKLYQGRISKGILLLEGFGSDQVTLRSLVNSFCQMGVQVFTFDLSGHGRLSGGLDFNNAEDCPKTLVDCHLPGITLELVDTSSWGFIPLRD